MGGARPRLRALVLCGGFGRRLRPLTLHLPKPLLPVAGEPIVCHTLRHLAAAGCEAAVLNLHHLGQSIADRLGDRFAGMDLEYSREERILGTFGALAPPRDFLAAADLVLLVNGDSFCAWPFKAMIRRHQRTAADATLLLLRRPPEAALGGGVGVGKDGRVLAMRDSPPAGEIVRRHVFAGAHVLSPTLLEGAEERPSDIIAELYRPLLADGGRVQSLITGRLWHDLGTPRRYLDAVLDVARGRWPKRLWRGARVAAGARVAPSAELRRACLEETAEAGAECRVDHSVLLAGARLGTGSRVYQTLVGPGVALPPAVDVARRMITRAPDGYQPQAGESVLGDLVYTPLGEEEKVSSAPSER